MHVFLKNGKNGVNTLLGKTEMILNNLNPDFTKSFIVDYFFEKEQTMTFKVYDVDDGGSDDFIGQIEVSVGKIMGSQKQTFVGSLTLPGKTEDRGKIVVRGDAVQASNHEVHLAVSARVTSLAGCCGNDQPYLLIQRQRTQLDKEFVRVF